MIFLKIFVSHDLSVAELFFVVVWHDFVHRFLALISHVRAWPSRPAGHSRSQGVFTVSARCRTMTGPTAHSPSLLT